jgi:phenylalanyl-tRNA synthetase alpha chain
MDKQEEIKKGTEHPLSLIINDSVKIFTDLGFEIATGPELETEWYNFDALNVPAGHPARAMQDTFWIKDRKGEVLRTHMTGTSVRAIECAAKEGRMPCAFVSIGKVFRNESTDAGHEMQFHQIDGIMVGENVTMANLKFVLLDFFKKLLGDGAEIRLRPSFFPFVEPGVEVDVKVGERWLEMLGAGMIHPNVLKNAGIDPEKYQGFAFGIGADRLLVTKYGIPDVRFSYQGDLRLNQF